MPKGASTHPNITPKRTDLFLSKVDVRGPDECWRWTACQQKGYGHFDDGAAHRFAWELAHGRTVARGMVIMHSCDNRLCCNPAHLSEGTQRDNVRDMRRKLRGYGQAHWKAVQP